ncbi:MAG: hypothetical protein MJ249_04015 [Kiritimatiellae bacterium]|nr:hypothetical protein [Kiritimatiellia bacterium]
MTRKILAAFVAVVSMMGWAVDLPADYTSLEWIQSSGTQWIDTGHRPTAETKIEARFNTCIRTVGWGVFFGVTGNDSAADGVLMRYYNATDDLSAWSCGSVEHVISNQRNQDVTVVLERNAWTVNGTEVAVPSAGTPYAGNLYLFCGNNGGSPWRHQTTRFYSFKMSEGARVVRDFVPCRTPGGENGLWDKTEGKFYGNLGTGRFYASDDPALRITGLKAAGQWIDTGVRAKSVINSIVDFTFLSSGGSTSFIGVRKTYGPSNEYGFWANGSGQACIAYGNVNSGWKTNKYPVGTRCVVSNDCAKLFIDGTLVHNGANNTFDTGYNVVIGAYSEKGVITTTGNRAFSGIFYKVKITQDGALKRDFVPWRNGDGMCGLYDVSSGNSDANNPSYPFYGNKGDGVFTSADDFAFLVDGTTLQVYEGTLTAANLAGFTAVEKKGVYAVKAGTLTNLSVPLTLSEGRFSLQNGAVETFTVNGTLTFAGGARLIADVTANGCDSLAATQVALTATAENPFIIELAPQSGVAFDADHAPTLIAGVAADDLAKFRLAPCGLDAQLAVQGGNLVLLVAQPALPAGYSRLDWIASSGEQYILTGVEATPQMQVEMSFRVNRYVTNGAIFGTDAWTGYRYLFNMQSNKFMFHAAGNDLLALQTGVDYTVRTDGTTATMTGGGQTKTAAIANNINAVKRELAVFAMNTGTYGTHIRLYSMVLRDASGQLLRSFVPCRAPRGEAGLWDLVEGKFYGNRGSGRFADPDDTLRLVNAIASHGNDYIDTQYTATATTKMTMDAVPVRADIKSAFFGVWQEDTYATSGLTFGVYINGNKNAASTLLTGQNGDWLSNQKPLMAGSRYFFSLDAVTREFLCWRDGDFSRTYDSISHTGSVTGQTLGPIWIFAANAFSGKSGHTGLYYGQMKVYTADIYESDVLKRAYRPAWTADGQLGLCDVQNGNTFYPNASTVSGANLTWEGIAFTRADSTLTAYEGTLTAGDLDGVTVLVKSGWHVLDAAAVTTLPVLQITKGTFSVADGTARTTTVSGSMTLVGGARLALDLTPAGCDSFSPTAVMFDNATEENPVEIDLSIQSGTDLTRSYVLVSSGVTGENGRARFIRVNSDEPIECFIQDGALVLRYGDTTSPVRAEWKGGADGRVDDAANWKCYNSFGEEMPGVLPTEKTTVVLPDGCVFNCPAGATFICKELVMPKYIGGDCDWSGLTVPIETAIDLRGHQLTLASLNGSGQVYDSTCFAPVEYVESAGASYVNTLYRHQPNTRVECVVDATDPSEANWRAAFGARNVDYKKSCFVFFLRDGSGMARYARTGDEAQYSGTFPYSQRVKIVCEGATATVFNGDTGSVFYSITTVGTLDGGVNDMFIFGLNQGGENGVSVQTTSLSKLKLYSFKIYEGETLMRDFQPVKCLTTGNYGLWDAVTCRFFASGNTSPLTGPAVAVDGTPMSGELHVVVPAETTLTGKALAVDGSVRLVKDGAGVLLWNGGRLGAGVTTLVTNGVFKAGANDTAFAAHGPIVIREAGQFDLNAHIGGGGSTPFIGTKFFVEGEGPDGTGAIVNNGSNNYGYHLSDVQLTGDATFGGVSRIDFRGTTDLEGTNATLTVKNSSVLALVDAASKVNVGHLVVSDGGILQPCEFNASTLKAQDITLLRGGEIAYWSGTGTWNVPVRVGEGGGEIYAQYGSEPYTYVQRGTVTVDAGSTLALTSPANKTINGTLESVVLNGTLNGANAKATTTITSLLSGNGTVTGVNVKMSGTNSCWRLEVGEGGFTSRVNLDAAPGDFLAGLARMEIYGVRAGTDFDICSAGTLTLDQLKMIVLKAFDAAGEEVLGCRLTIEESRIHAYFGDATIPRTAVWNGSAEDFDLANPDNWTCVNDFGNEVVSVPTRDTTVTIPDGCVFNVTNGAPLLYRELIYPKYIGGDCDWTGLARPINSTIDLRGHKLVLSSLAGTGTITDTSTHGTYERLSYIQSNSKGEYIDTGVIGKNGIHMEIDVKMISNGGSAMLVGERPKYPGATSNCGFWVNGDGIPAIGYGLIDSGYETGASGIKNTRCVLTNSHARLFKDGVMIIDRTDNTTFNSNVSITLFALHTSSKVENTGTRVITAQVFGLKIWDENTLLRDFVPVRRVSDGKVGLIDRAHADQFYTSSVALTAGPVVPFDDEPCGELHVNVPSGQTLENTSLTITRLVKVVKEGAGTFKPTKGQDYSGGTVIAEGKIVCNGSSEFYLGCSGGKVTIDAGATLDFDGHGNQVYYTFVLNGGTIRSATDRGESGYAWMRRVELTADSVMSGDSFGFVGLGWAPTTLEMNGHTLTVDITVGKLFYMGNLTITGGGTLYARSGGWLVLGGSSSDPTTGSIDKYVTAETTTLEVTGVALCVDSATVCFANYYPHGGQTYDRKKDNQPILVTGRVTPVSAWHDCQLQSGATLDLSQNAASWTGVTTFSNNANKTGVVSCVDGATIYVDVGSRPRRANLCLIAWTAETRPDATFVPVPGSDFELYTTDDGLFMRRGFLIILR